MVIGPQIDDLAGELRAVIAVQAFWAAAQSAQPIQNSDDIARSQLLSHLNGRPNPTRAQIEAAGSAARLLTQSPAVPGTIPM